MCKYDYECVVVAEISFSLENHYLIQDDTHQSMHSIRKLFYILYSTTCGVNQFVIYFHLLILRIIHVVFYLELTYILCQYYWFELYLLSQTNSLYTIVILYHTLHFTQTQRCTIALRTHVCQALALFLPSLLQVRPDTYQLNFRLTVSFPVCYTCI